MDMDDRRALAASRMRINLRLQQKKIDQHVRIIILGFFLVYTSTIYVACYMYEVMYCTYKYTQYYCKYSKTFILTIHQVPFLIADHIP